MPEANIVALKANYRPIAFGSNLQKHAAMEDVSHDQNDQSCVCFGPRVVSTGDPACAHSEPDSMTTMSVKHVGQACTASMASAFVPPLDVTRFGA